MSTYFECRECGPMPASACLKRGQLCPVCNKHILTPCRDYYELWEDKNEEIRETESPEKD